MKQEWKELKRVPWEQQNRKERRHLGTVIWLVSDQGNVKRDFYDLEDQFVKSKPVNQHWKGRTKKYLAIPTGAYTHRLVAEMFIPNPEGMTMVTFMDNDLTNTSVKNLMWTNTRKR